MYQDLQNIRETEEPVRNKYKLHLKIPKRLGSKVSNAYAVELRTFCHTI